MSSAATSVVVEADGGSRGNPGPAGYGAVVLDSHDAVLAERKQFLGTTTNNVAEYSGLIAGLRAAADLGAREVEVRMDSKLVVEQMSGRWKVKNADLAVLHREAKGIAAQFDTVSYTWIPRARNARADLLANEAMDAGTADPAAPLPPDPKAEHGTKAPVAAPQSPGWMATSGAPTRLLLLRHGQTPLSVEKRYSGRGNPGLTDLGRTQAARAARRFGDRGGVAAVVTSPLARAHATATAVADALGLPVTEHEGLIETDFGDWEGLTFTEAAERDPDVHAQWLADTSVPAPGGESFDAVRARVEATRADLTERYAGGNVLVVSHVTPIKTFLQLALDAGPGLLYKLHLDLASLSIAEFYGDGGSSVRLVNDTSHLA